MRREAMRCDGFSALPRYFSPPTWESLKQVFSFHLSFVLFPRIAVGVLQSTVGQQLPRLCHPSLPLAGPSQSAGDKDVEPNPLFALV